MYVITNILDGSYVSAYNRPIVFSTYRNAINTLMFFLGSSQLITGISGHSFSEYEVITVNSIDETLYISETVLEDFREYPLIILDKPENQDGSL